MNVFTRGFSAGVAVEVGVKEAMAVGEEPGTAVSEIGAVGDASGVGVGEISVGMPPGVSVYNAVMTSVGVSEGVGVSARATN